MCAGLLATGRGVLAGETGVPQRVHVVVEGDTLWSIAVEQVGGEGDPRPLVDVIQQANEVDAGKLVPGRRLVIPEVA